MEKFNVKNLNSNELSEINGGSELTDAIWYGVGFTLGYLKRSLKLTYSTGVFK